MIFPAKWVSAVLIEIIEYGRRKLEAWLGRKQLKQDNRLAITEDQQREVVRRINDRTRRK
jgi:hypothetical protein